MKQGLMNMLNQQLLSQARQKNPQAFRLVEEMQKSNSNPKDILDQMTKNLNKEQMESFMSYAKSYGVPDDILKQLQK